MQTPEERLLAQANDEPVAVPSTSAAAETPKERLVAAVGGEPAAQPSTPPATEVDARGCANGYHWERGQDARRVQKM